MHILSLLILLVSGSLSASIGGEAIFQCYECKSRISIEDCDGNKTLRNCNDNVVVFDHQVWSEPNFDRCLTIVDTTFEPLMIRRRCGFEELYLHYIRDKCHDFLCMVQACFEPRCLSGSNQVSETSAAIIKAK